MTITRKHLLGMIQYAGIYYLCSSVGGSILQLNSALYGIGTIAYLALVLLVLGRTTIQKWYLSLTAMLVGSMLLTMVYTRGSLSVFSVGTMISRYIVLWSMIAVCPEKFISRFLKYAHFTVCVSLIFFVLSNVVGYGTLASIGIPLGGGLRSLLLYNISPVHYGKNIGMFGEPGQYQVFLCVAMYVVILLRDSIGSKQTRRYLTAFLIAMLTAFSTAGFIALLGFFAFAIFRRDMRLRTKVLVLLGVLVFAVYVLFFLDKTSMLYYAILGKITTSDNKISLAGGSGGARVESILEVLGYIWSNPASILGIGYERLEAMQIEACASIFVTLLTFGLVSWLIMYGSLLWGLRKSAKNYSELFLGAYIILVAGLSQPNMLNPTLLIMAFSLLLCQKTSRISRTGGNESVNISITD